MDIKELVPIKSNPKVQAFQPGDTVKVDVKVREGDRERIQAFQGVVIKMRSAGAGSSFTVRRVSSGIGVERTFLLHSPDIASLQVLRRGVVRRARLYYLRGLSGRQGRIREKRREIVATVAEEKPQEQPAAEPQPEQNPEQKQEPAAQA